ncbi:unnamed protein product, partial [Prorocentrum cordatum]
PPGRQQQLRQRARQAPCGQGLAGGRQAPGAEVGVAPQRARPLAVTRGSAPAASSEQGRTAASARRARSRRAGPAPRPGGARAPQWQRGGEEGRPAVAALPGAPRRAGRAAVVSDRPPPRPGRARPGSSATARAGCTPVWPCGRVATLEPQSAGRRPQRSRGVGSAGQEGVRVLQRLCTRRCPLSFPLPLPLHPRFRLVPSSGALAIPLVHALRPTVVRASAAPLPRRRERAPPSGF